jgi:transposase
MIIYGFGLDFQVYELEKLLPDIAQSTIIEWYSLLRNICSKRLLTTPFQLSGNISGNVIEIDESLFGKKRKYNRGSGNQKIWVFGCIEKSTRNAFVQIVERRDRETLMPLITQNVAKGSTIYSDQWAAYFTLKDEGYTHDTVNHSKEFKSSTDCCTNTIEGLWSLIKLKIKKMKGINSHRLPQILDEFMWTFQ